jgi:hypothetical protein
MARAYTRNERAKKKPAVSGGLSMQPDAKRTD